MGRACRCPLSICLGRRIKHGPACTQATSEVIARQDPEIACEDGPPSASLRLPPCACVGSTLWPQIAILSAQDDVHGAAYKSVPDLKSLEDSTLDCCICVPVPVLQMVGLDVAPSGDALHDEMAVVRLYNELLRNMEEEPVLIADVAACERYYTDYADDCARLIADDHALTVWCRERQWQVTRFPHLGGDADSFARANATALAAVRTRMRDRCIAASASAARFRALAARFANPSDKLVTRSKIVEPAPIGAPGAVHAAAPGGILPPPGAHGIGSGTLRAHGRRLSTHTVICRE